MEGRGEGCGGEGRRMERGKVKNGEGRGKMWRGGEKDVEGRGGEKDVERRDEGCGGEG